MLYACYYCDIAFTICVCANIYRDSTGLFQWATEMRWSWYRFPSSGLTVNVWMSRHFCPPDRSTYVASIAIFASVQRDFGVFRFA